MLDKVLPFAAPTPGLRHADIPTNPSCHWLLITLGLYGAGGVCYHTCPPPGPYQVCCQAAVALGHSEEAPVAHWIPWVHVLPFPRCFSGWFILAATAFIQTQWASSGSILPGAGVAS